MAKPAIAARVAEMLKLVKLEKFPRAQPHQLSGGQRQRVALARAVAESRRFCCSTSRSAPSTRSCAKRPSSSSMDIQVELGITFIIVTHDQEEAMTMSDRIAVMDHGKLAQVAPPGEIYEQPNSNMSPTSSATSISWREGHRPVRQRRERRLEHDRRDPDGREPGEPGGGPVVYVAVRPEKMQISFDAPNGSANTLSGEVFDIGYLGDWTNYLVDVAGGSASACASARPI